MTVYNPCDYCEDFPCSTSMWSRCRISQAGNIEINSLNKPVSEYAEQINGVFTRWENSEIPDRLYKAVMKDSLPWLQQLITDMEVKCGRTN